MYLWNKIPIPPPMFTTRELKILARFSSRVFRATSLSTYDFFLTLNTTLQNNFINENFLI